MTETVRSAPDPYETPATNQAVVGERLQGINFEYWTILGGIYDPELRPPRLSELDRIYDSIRVYPENSDARPKLHAITTLDYAIHLCNPEIVESAWLDKLIKREIEASVLEASRYSQEQLLYVLPKLTPSLDPDSVPVSAALRAIFAMNVDADGDMREGAIHSRARRLSRAALERFYVHEVGLSTELVVALKATENSVQ